MSELDELHTTRLDRVVDGGYQQHPDFLYAPRVALQLGSTNARRQLWFTDPEDLRELIRVASRQLVMLESLTMQRNQALAARAAQEATWDAGGPPADVPSTGTGDPFAPLPAPATASAMAGEHASASAGAAAGLRMTPQMPPPSPRPDMARPYAPAAGAAAVVPSPTPQPRSVPIRSPHASAGDAPDPQQATRPTT